MTSGGCELPEGVSPLVLGTPEWWEAVAPRIDYHLGLWYKNTQKPFRKDLEDYPEDKYQLYAGIFYARSLVWEDVRENFGPFVERESYPDSELGVTGRLFLTELSAAIARYDPDNPDTAWMRPYVVPNTEAEMTLPYWLFMASCVGGFQSISVEQCRDISLDDFWPIYQQWLP